MQSPLLGFNNNVKHRGRVFHIQTEDSGLKHPHIITHLFADGGRILKTTKTSYAEHIGNERLADMVRDLMKRQHRAMFVALRGGEFDHLLSFDDQKPAPAEAKQGAPAAAVAASPAPPAAAVAVSAPVGAPPPPAPPSFAAAAQGSASAPLGVAPAVAPPPPPPRRPTEASDKSVASPPRIAAAANGAVHPSAPQVAASAAAAAAPVMKAEAPGRAAAPAPQGASSRSRAAQRTEPEFDMDATPPLGAPAIPLSVAAAAAPAASPPGARPGPAGTRAVSDPTREKKAPASGRYVASRPATGANHGMAEPGRSIFGEDLISEKSLDEVILSYLSEDLDGAAGSQK